MKRRSLVRAACAAVLILAAAVLPLRLFADTINVVPDNQGLLSSHPDVEFLPLLISNCAPPEAPVPCPGDQFYPKVDGNLATYIAGPPSGPDYRAAYYDFFSGATNFIPSPSPGFDWSYDYLPAVSGGKIAFYREEGTTTSVSTAILVYDTSNGSTTEIKRFGPANSVYFVWDPAIGANTVVFADLSTYPGELWAANLGDLGTGSTRLTHNDDEADMRFDEWPSVSPSGDVIVWQSCVPFSPGNCDISKATLSAGTWTVAAVTTDEYVENYPKTDGTLIAYTKRPAGSDVSVFDQQDICWQPVAGGTETCLALEGYQTWPSVRGRLIAFSSAPTAGSDADLYVYDLATNRLFQMTSTEGANEELADLTVLPDGRFRVVWDDGKDDGQALPNYIRDVWGVTFTLPDIEAPVIECDAADGFWHADNVSLECAAVDEGKGLANPQDANFVLTTNVAVGEEWADAFTNSHDVCDTALPEANCATAGPIGGNKIDLRAPTVSVTTPAAGATYTLGEVVAADYSCQDGGSGVQSCAAPVLSGQPIDTATPGTKTFPVAGTDNVGHTTVVNVSYTVEEPGDFDFGGFLPPVDAPPIVNSMKAGAAVAVKFSLGGFRGLSIFAAGYPQSQAINCTTSAPQDAIEQTVTAGGSSLSYDATADVYSYVWKTDKTWAGTCRQLVVQFTDGSTGSAIFTLK